jgi:hypothetical protein
MRKVLDFRLVSKVAKQTLENRVQYYNYRIEYKKYSQVPARRKQKSCFVVVDFLVVPWEQYCVIVTCRFLSSLFMCAYQEVDNLHEFYADYKPYNSIFPCIENHF